MPTLEERRAAELAKYEAIYSDTAKFCHYGSGASDNWQAVWPAICKEKPKLIADVGTGQGHFPVIMAETFGTKCYACDFAWPGESTKEVNGVTIEYARAPAHALPWADKSMDWVTSFDVLEHFLPEEVEDCIAEMLRVARVGLFLTVATFPTSLDIGDTLTELHPTVRSYLWWWRLLGRLTGDEFGETIEHTVDERLPRHGFVVRLPNA